MPHQIDRKTSARDAHSYFVVLSYSAAHQENECKTASDKLMYLVSGLLGLCWMSRFIG